MRTDRELGSLTAEKRLSTGATVTDSAPEVGVKGPKKRGLNRYQYHFGV